MPDFSKINTFILDVDGVLTDGSVISFKDGEHARRFYVKDGYAIEKALHKGYHVIVITGGFEEGVKNRLQFLGIKDIFMGVKDKMAIFETYKIEKGIENDQILYMGDDIPDMKMLQLVGISTCPKDASNDILAISEYVSPFKGGRGCVRDVIEKVMKARGDWAPNEW